MPKKIKIFFISFVVIGMIVSLFTINHTYANDEVLETFYVLDENGDPITVELTAQDVEQAKIEKEAQTYQVITFNDEERVILDEFEHIDDALASYQESVEFFNSVSTYTNDSSSTNVEVVTNDNEVVATTENIIGIVRFNLDNVTINYIETDSSRKGYLAPAIIGDAAYIRTEDDGVVVRFAGTQAKVSSDYVTIESYENNNISYYYASDGYFIHRTTYYNNGTLTASSYRVGYQPSYIKTGTNYYSYDGHYFYDSFETMINDYRNNVYTSAVNASNPYYNYYQYISMHTTTEFTAEQYDNYIKSKKPSSVMIDAGDDFVTVQNEYTINSVLMLGVAINESGWGTSNLAVQKNNLFGLNAIDSSPFGSGSTYNSIADCIREFGFNIIHKKYLNGTHSFYHGPHLGDKHSGINIKYASDPYWGEKAASRPYYFDTNKVDYGRYTLGIANKGIVSLYKEASTSKKLYTSEPATGSGLYDYPVTILGEETVNDVKYYKVISDMSLLDDRSSRNVEDIFKPSRDYVYIKASDITIVFEGNGKDIIIPDPEEGGETVEPDVPVEPEVPTYSTVTHEEVLSSLKLTNTNNYLTGFTIGNDLSSIITKIKSLNDLITVTAKDKDGNTITSGKLATGMKITVDTNQSAITYTVVIRGDVNGDGKISAIDYVKIRNYLDDKTNLENAYAKAADINDDGKISAIDYVKTRNHLDGKSTITQ